MGWGAEGDMGEMMRECLSGEGFISFRGYRSWYRVEKGELAQGRYPLLTIHDGPGATHYGLLPLERLAERGWPVIFYDQSGCGCSDHPTNDALWSFQFFLDELETLRATLGLDTVHLLGHGWGGMLALEYLLTRPPGVLSLTLASSIACGGGLLAEQRRLFASPCSLTPVRLRRWRRAAPGVPTLCARLAVDAQYRCRHEPWTGFLQEVTARLHLELNQYMWERGYKTGSGELCTWDIRPCLDCIQLPTLITAGRYDGYAPGQHHLLYQGMPHSELLVFEESAHYAHAEETERYLTALGAFLLRVESQSV
jgi:pimeloyl-ACP methyl ester carboxylesterase